MKVPIGILVGRKGRGSNMAALIDRSRSATSLFEVHVVLGHTSSPALERAAEMGVATKGFSTIEELVDLIKSIPVKVVALAGYMSLLPLIEIGRSDLVYLNIHPALLPKFGGKGMYGHHVHEAVIQARERVSGATVHYVNERYDEGSIVLQRTCPVLEEDTPESLAARVLEQEHLLYPEAIEKIISEHRLGS